MATNAMKPLSRRSNDNGTKRIEKKNHRKKKKSSNVLPDKINRLKDFHAPLRGSYEKTIYKPDLINKLLSPSISYTPKDESIHDCSSGVSESSTASGSSPSDEMSSQRQPSNNYSTSSLLSELREEVISHPHQQVTLTCYIPPSRVGAIIGRRGTTIVKIQHEASKSSRGHPGQVRLSVLSKSKDLALSSSTSINSLFSLKKDSNLSSDNKNSEIDGNLKNSESIQDYSDPWTPVVIRADPVGAFAAAHLLIPLLIVPEVNTSNDNDTSLSVCQICPLPSPTEMDDVVLDVPIHRSRHSAIIGRKGLMIASLSADYNVRIMVPHRTADNESRDNISGPGTHHKPSSINIVQLEGDLDNVERCLAAIFSVICTSYSSTEKNINYCDGRSEHKIFNCSETVSNKYIFSLKKLINNNIGSSLLLKGEECVDLPSRKVDTTSGVVLNKQLIHNSNNVNSKSPALLKQEVIQVKNARNKKNSSRGQHRHENIDVSITSKGNSSKFIEKTLTIPSQYFHLVPSLGKIRNLCRSSNTVIRRKRMESSNKGELFTKTGVICDEDYKTKNSRTVRGANINNKVNSTLDSSANEEKFPCTTQLIISGRSFHVNNAITQIEKMLDVSSLSAKTKLILNDSDNTTSIVSSTGMSTITGKVDDVTSCNNSLSTMTISTTPTVTLIFKDSASGADIEKNINKSRADKNIDLQSQIKNGMSSDKTKSRSTKKKVGGRSTLSGRGRIGRSGRKHVGGKSNGGNSVVGLRCEKRLKTPMKD